MMNIDFDKPFAIIKRKQDLNPILLTGEIEFLDNLSQIPRENNNLPFNTLSMIPFSQIKERNYAVRDSGLKISCLKIETFKEVEEEEIINLLPDEIIELEDEIKNLYPLDEYEKIIEKVIKEEIGNGEGANFVIPNSKTFKIKDFSVKKVLSIFNNLLKNEINSYWTFIFFDGEKFLVGATPEAHIVVKNGRVKMHPISGTFRKKRGQIINLKEFRKDFISFLNDEKEINELFMVVDEELKMMANFCEEGGMIIGPLLKEMTALIHTEYLLTGKTKKDIIELLRESMYAATVVGSPIESACRIIKKYEPTDRRYFGSTIALIGDEEGEEFLDSPITIRTIEVNLEGEVLVKVGSTLVRNSNYRDEVDETEVKIASMIQNITRRKIYSSKRLMQFIEEDDEILEALYQRNQKLSRFWFFNQEDEEAIIPKVKGKKITIINNEDDFCFMLKHMLRKIGAIVEIVRFDKYEYQNDNSLLTIIGPGPGNPNNLKDKKISKVYTITQKFLNSDRKFLSVCLGHQLLCKALNIRVVKKATPQQGVPEKINFFGKREIVGFYNTFEGRLERDFEELNFSINEKTKAINAIFAKSHQFASFQFHPESILSQNGFNILRDTINYILE